MELNALINPSDPLERQNEKLWKITTALMQRVERSTEDDSAAYAHFQRALLLEEEVRQRTRDLEQTLELLNRSNAQLSEANEAAQRARSDLANALEAVQEGFALFNHDDRLVLCNSRFGMHMPDLAAKLRPGLHFDDYIRSASRSPYLALPVGQSPEDWAEERAKKHSERHVNFNARLAGDRWIQVSEHRTADGGTAILQTDITDMIRLERQEREKLLDDQARLIRATLDHINQGICIFDSQHRLIGWNHRLSILLNPPIHLLRVGTSFSRLFEHLSRDLTFSEGQSADEITGWVEMTKGRPALTAHLIHGEDTHLDLFAQEMPDAGFVISFTDSTVERRAIRAMYKANEMLEQRVLQRTLALEDALEEAERANASKSRFVAAASHDLLQPLSAAKLFLSSLESMALDGGAEQIIGRTRSALASVETILAALLDISKLDLGQAAVDVSPVPIPKILRPLRDEFTAMARQKDLDFRMVNCNLVVQSDPAYLRRILQNLIANAIRYTRSGKVLVGARRDGAEVRIEVWDTGPGIPEDQRENIFKEFQRLEDGGGGSEGMGLGLAIVERAAALLGHPLGMRSEPGRGTVFHISVPIANSKAVKSVQKPPERQLRHPADNLIALVVDNDKEVRQAIATLLDSWGIGVFDVASEAEALTLLNQIDIVPDVMLVDYHLDENRNGLECITNLRRLFGAVPAVLITADRSDRLDTICASAGIDLMRKPLPTEQLHAFLRSAGTMATAPEETQPARVRSGESAQ